MGQGSDRYVQYLDEYMTSGIYTYKKTYQTYIF